VTHGRCNTRPTVTFPPAELCPSAGTSLRTENGNDDVILDDLEWPGDDEADGVEAFSLVEHDITWRDVEDGEADRQCPEAAVVGAAERRVLVKHSSVEMDTDVRSRTRRTVTQYLNG